MKATLCQGISLPLQIGNFGSQIIRGVDPPSPLSNSKIDCRRRRLRRGHWRFPVRHRRHREVRVSSVTMTTTTRIHLTAENTTATATTDFSAAAAHFQISPTLHSCHNDPGKNPPDNRLRRPTDRPTKCLVSRWRRREGQLGRLPLPVGDSRSLSLTSLRISHASTVKAKSQRDLPNGPAAGRATASLFDGDKVSSDRTIGTY